VSTPAPHEPTATDATPATPAKPAIPSVIPRKTLIVVGVVAAALWAMAIGSGSASFMITVGVLTAMLLGLLTWGWRLVRKQRKLATLIQGAVESPEARREALASLQAGKNSNKDLAKVYAQAHLMAADDPAAALALLESVPAKKIPVAMQDDFGLLQAQLYLGFGRAKEARPLVDRMNPDNPQRAEVRGMMVAVIAETWARTGSAAEAVELLATANPSAEANEQVKSQLLIAQAHARFGVGNKGAARAAIKQLAAINVELLGRFVAPQFQAHPGLQRLAREEAQRHPGLRRLASGPAGQKQRRGRPR
jgi:hypothetical protein